MAIADQKAHVEACNEVCEDEDETEMTEFPPSARSSASAKTLAGLCSCSQDSIISIMTRRMALPGAWDVRDGAHRSGQDVGEETKRQRLRRGPPMSATFDLSSSNDRKRLCYVGLETPQQLPADGENTGECHNVCTLGLSEAGTPCR